MRKRAQRKGILVEEPKHIMSTVAPERKPSAFKKNWWVAVSLIGIFLLVLFLNSYFNISSGATFNSQGQGLDKYYLSGPDPYYNMRLVNETLYGEKAGHYPFYYGSVDPLLNYPLGKSGGRPPFLNMMAICFSRLLLPFMNEIDAVGYSMQFVPALFGALLVFPIYFIGETLFGKKAGLVGAFLVALIPVHIGSGHGSAYTLFDHDSLNLLLFFLSFLFLIKGIKDKDPVKSVLYALLSGVSIGALYMTWVEGQFLYVIIAIYAVVQMLIDIFMNKMELKVVITTLVALSSGYLISLPVRVAGGFNPDVPLFLCLGIAAFSLIYFIFNRKKIPWTISLPAIFCISGVALAFLYFVRYISPTIPFFSSLSELSNIIYGSGIYGNKVSMTIAEASTYNISHTVMSFGPALYWLAWAGFLFLLYYYYKNKQRRDYLFIIVLFIVDIWLTGIAGRFINDIVPLIALLGGWVVWIVVDKIDYKQMIRNIRSAGGGFHGLRRGVKFFHIVGILFIAFLVILPNAYIAFDAAVPVNKKADVFGSGASEGAFGLSTYKEAYWIDAYNWLNKQDTDISDPAKRPAFISWWDYGFYEVALGAHPTVADNFQDGIPPAANFHTATSEKEAVAVWIVRLLEGNIRDNNGLFSNSVIEALENHLGKNETDNITKWMKGNSPSYNMPIGEKYNEELSKEWLVGQQYEPNAYYHDISKLLTDSLDDEGITWLYHDIQNATSYSIRYYGVEGYDKQIFNIFGFLADKSLLMVASQSGNPEDDFEKIMFVGYHVNTDGSKGVDDQWSYDELKNMSTDEKRYIAITSTSPVYKDAYFDTMFYRTYIGPASGTSGQKQEFSYQLPCIDMKHFYAEYISNYSRYAYYQGQSAVVIAKYYEGAYINGSVTFMGEPLSAQVVVQKNITHYGTTIPVDHDKNSTNADGVFHVIAGAGSILQISRNLGDAAVILLNVSFDGPSGSAYAPINDDDAMRQPDSNYERWLNISIQPANLSGYIFDDKDDDGIFNSSVDQPLNDVNVVATEILIIKSETDQTTGQTQQSINKTGNVVNVTCDENGSYNFSGILPGLYRLEFYDEKGFVLDIIDIEIYEGDNIYNVKKPKSANIEGIVYYDANLNEEYNDGEEISGASVKIYHYYPIPIINPTSYKQELIGETTTDADGNYSFKGLFPGKINGREFNTYVIEATSLPEYTSQVGVYPEENQTTIENISLSLVPANVSGFTKYADKTVGGITINFDPDESKEINTAETNQIISESGGSYLVTLKPGSYNVSISKKEGDTLVYSFNGKLKLDIGQGNASYDISMNKNSSTVNGITSFDGKNKDNVSITFKPDGSENNTAVTATAKSDTNGSYTVELALGRYNVTVVNQMRTEEGQNYTYSFEGSLDILAVPSPESYNIVLAREATT
jgi:dolichyl-diphosphooligosaccharide--protein glycosyltransferase